MQNIREKTYILFCISENDQVSINNLIRFPKYFVFILSFIFSKLSTISYLYMNHLIIKLSYLIFKEPCVCVL